jgi:hypothetical protein
MLNGLIMDEQENEEIEEKIEYVEESLEGKSGKERKIPMKLTNISLWLDFYTDIFSDFDPRPYSERTLSDDFLYEAKKASRETIPGRVELKLLIPKKRRNLRHEAIIKKRLHEYFSARAYMLQEMKKGILKQGFAFLFVGVAIMLFTTYMLFESDGKSFITTFLSVLMEPAGWFLFWEGLHLVVFGSKERKNDLEFNEKMSKSTITFMSY